MQALFLKSARLCRLGEGAARHKRAVGRLDPPKSLRVLPDPRLGLGGCVGGPQLRRLLILYLRLL